MFRFVLVACVLALPAVAQDATTTPPQPKPAPAESAPAPTVPLPIMPAETGGCGKTRQMTS